MHPVRVHRYHSIDLQKLHCINLVTVTDDTCGGGRFPAGTKREQRGDME